MGRLKVSCSPVQPPLRQDSNMEAQRTGSHSIHGGPPLQIPTQGSPTKHIQIAHALCSKPCECRSLHSPAVWVHSPAGKPQHQPQQLPVTCSVVAINETHIQVPILKATIVPTSTDIGGRLRHQHNLGQEPTLGQESFLAVKSLAKKSLV